MVIAVRSIHIFRDKNTMTISYPYTTVPISNLKPFKFSQYTWYVRINTYV